MCLPLPAGRPAICTMAPCKSSDVFLEETYNDNIYATPADTQSDWITTITPGLKLFLPVRMHQFTVEYNAVINTYKDFTGENTTDHNARAIADFKLGSFFGLKLSDTYVKGHEARDFSRTGILDTRPMPRLFRIRTSLRRTD